MIFENISFKCFLIVLRISQWLYICSELKYLPDVNDLMVSLMPSRALVNLHTTGISHVCFYVSSNITTLDALLQKILHMLLYDEFHSTI